jgi:hypothetical protein
MDEWVDARDERIIILESRLAGIFDAIRRVRMDSHQLSKINRARIEWIYGESMPDEVPVLAQNFRPSEAGQGVMEYTGLLTLAAVVLLLLALAFTTVWPKIAASLATVSLASPSASEAVSEIAPSDLADVELNEHALASHGEIAAQAQENILKCKPQNYREMDGLGDYKGYKLLACPFENGKLAVWVVTQDAEGKFRTITAFISKSAKYLDTLIQAGKYIPVQ